MAILDRGKQQKAKKYNRIKRRFWVVETIFNLAYILAWLLTGSALGLRLYLVNRWPMMNNDWILVPVYILIFGIFSMIFEIPFTYFTEFVLPHRFDQSDQSLRSWIIDQIKGFLISLPIGLIILELLYLALRVSGSFWWLWAAGGLLIFQVLLINLAPVLIMPIFNKYVPLGDEHAELTVRLMELAKKANTRVQGVFKFDMSKQSKSANAALTGLGNTRRIILGDTLISEFSTDEIETILAHELGHHVHQDIPLLIGFGTISISFGLYLASLFMNWAVAFFGFSGISDPAAFPAFALVISLYGLLIMPIENGFSRWRERIADQYALQLTGKNEALASGFIRLANQNLGEIEPEKWEVFFFHSHPPLGERISMAKNWNKS